MSRSLEAVPRIKKLRVEAETIREIELARLLRYLPNVTVEEKAVLEQFSRSIVKKLLHKPIELLKNSDPMSHGKRKGKYDSVEKL